MTKDSTTNGLKTTEMILSQSGGQKTDPGVGRAPPPLEALGADSSCLFQLLKEAFRPLSQFGAGADTPGTPWFVHASLQSPPPSSHGCFPSLCVCLSPNVSL